MRKCFVFFFWFDLLSEIRDNEGIIYLMEICWDNDFLMRLVFLEIKLKLKFFNCGK